MLWLRGVEVMLEWLDSRAPVVTDPSVQDIFGLADRSLGMTWEAVPSGARHDAVHTKNLGSLGMIFVPSVGGRSHVPEEFT